MLQARYSGTTSVANATSEEVTVTVEGASEDLTQLQQRLQGLIDEAKAIDQTTVAGATRAPLNDALAGASPVEGKTKDELETAISTLQTAMDEARLSIVSMADLKSTIGEATVFLDVISESAAKNSLVTAIQEADGVYKAEASTLEDVKAAQEKLSELLSATKKEAQPLPGQSFDMTEFLINPSFEEQTTGWSLSKQTSGWEAFGTWNDRPAADGLNFVSVSCENITSLDLYQTVSGLPAGFYRLEGALRNTDGRDFLSDQHLYAQTAEGTYESGLLSDVSGENNNEWFEFSVADIHLSAGGELRLGVRSSGTGTGTKGWFQADDFHLYYLGETPSAVHDAGVSTEGVDVTPVEGGVMIRSSVACRLPLYSIGGALQKILNVEVGVQKETLVRGQYVLNGKVIIVK
ncbi:MAG: hypothetical protein LUC45_05655 [Paraprevotella sp.]|nr:hypothetical protein [Paraprevotella sp.]